MTARCSSTCLSPQLLGGGSRRVSKTTLAQKEGWSQSVLCDTLYQKQKGEKEKKNYCLQYYHHSRFLWDLSLHPLPTSLIPSASLSLSKWFISRLKSLQEQKTFAHEIGIELCNLSISIQRQQIFTIPTFECIQIQLSNLW